MEWKTDNNGFTETLTSRPEWLDRYSRICRVKREFILTETTSTLDVLRKHVVDVAGKVGIVDAS